ncbi:hypothetical protein CaCOL14_005429 [Colletotrichum acutatum]
MYPTLPSHTLQDPPYSQPQKNKNQPPASCNLPAGAPSSRIILSLVDLAPNVSLAGRQESNSRKRQRRVVRPGMDSGRSAELHVISRGTSRKSVAQRHGVPDVRGTQAISLTPEKNRGRCRETARVENRAKKRRIRGTRRKT